MKTPDRDLLAILVHEVRSPVAALSAIAETYPDDRLEHMARRSLVDLVLAACRGVERVVSDATVASVRVAEVDLGRLVHEAVAAAVLGGGTIRALVAAGLPPLSADEVRLRQALDNLVSNALAHSSPDKEVVVSAQRRGVEVLLSVADEGPGIPSAEHERVFEAGVRLDLAHPGSGLGLAIARGIAEAHGGTLTVESVPGRGATFTIALPAP
jgi:signal transduction histidine kinase